MSTIVNVAAFRSETEHLWRLANVDYQACVGVHEVEEWKTTAARMLAEADGLECRRANPHDREQFSKAVTAVKVRLAEADDRIGHLQVSPKASSATQTGSGTDREATQRTAAEFKTWASTHQSLATTLRAARKFARSERERVDAYVLPIFQTFQFVDAEGQKIEQPKDLYLCEDEAACTAFYAQCNTAHLAHGFTGAEGQCPALIAESRVIVAEHAFLAAGCEFLGFKSIPSALYGGEKRERMLDILMTACLGEG